MKKLLHLNGIIVLVWALCGTLFAGTTGKIAGRVTDAETKEGLPGVNVVLQGTTLGAATDVNGEYVINNVPPGTYTVTASGVGYQRARVLSVKVTVDFTTRIDLKLSKEAIQMQEVVIQAEVPLVRKDLSSSYTSVDATQIRALPVESVTGVLSLQAGVVQGVGGELHIRGGRSNEIAYTVNGVSIANPFDNSKTVSVATNAIQELSVVSGTFNAEYGNALSGVVNTITKEGGETYTGGFSLYTGDNVSSRSDVFLNVKDVNGLANKVGEFAFGGPVPFLERDVKFFVSGRYEEDEGYLYGKREHNLWDSVYVNPRDPNDIRVASSGDNALIPMNPSKAFSGTAKLTFRPFQGVKVNYDMLYSQGWSRSYDHDFKYNPDGRLNDYSWGLLNALEIRHALSNKTFYVLQASYNLSDFKEYLFPLLDKDNNPVDYHPGMDYTQYHASPYYQPTEKLRTAATYTFLAGGTSNSHYYRRATTYGGRFDMTSQIDNNHEIKFGVSGRYHILDYESFTVRRDTSIYLSPTILPPSSAYHDLYTKQPIEVSAFIQDKMEFESLIINLGVRYDFFDARSRYSTNTQYPSPFSPSLPRYVNKDSLLTMSKGKHQFSPRFGISFPITDRGIIHFSYGHFLQMPSFAYLYSNPNFKSNFSTGDPTFGNSNLNPEKTVTYEIGLQQQLSNTLAFTITGFYKDVRDLLAVQQIRVSGDETYYKYVNKDYGNIRGLLFSLVKRRTPTDPLSVTVDYTLQVAEGNNTSADAFFMDLSSGRQSEKIPVYLGWDQTHTLNATASVGDIGNWNATVVGRFGTGLPYTPLIYANNIYLTPNSGRRPSQYRIDMMAEKYFTLGDVSLTVFLKVFNLFDTMIERSVYASTGRSTYTLDKVQGTAIESDKIAARVPGVHNTDDYFNRPSYYGAPREIKLGLSVDFR